jgi:hypothetical protein
LACHGLRDLAVQQASDGIGQEAASHAFPDQTRIGRDAQPQEGQAFPPGLGIRRAGGLQMLDGGGKAGDPHQRVGFGGVTP